MQNDPFETRRTGVRRLRVVTASLGAAAVVGTGALAWSVADTASASATGSTTDSTTTSTGSQFVAPAQTPGTTSSGGSHASSGGS